MEADYLAWEEILREEWEDARDGTSDSGEEEDDVVPVPAVIVIPPATATVEGELIYNYY